MVYSAISDSDNTVSQFTRRESIKLSHSGALTDYQKKITIPYKSAMQADFDDIRFVTSAGEHIPYWLESKTNSSTADVWIMNDYVTGDTYIWMYYGNSGLSSGSDGDDVFELHDDFEGTSLDTAKWEEIGTGGVSVSDSECHITGNGCGGSHGHRGIIGKTAYGYGYAVEFMVKTDSIAGNSWGGWSSIDNVNSVRVIEGSTDNAYYAQTESGGIYAYSIALDTQYHRISISRVSSSSIKYDYDYGEDPYELTNTTYIPTVDLLPQLTNWIPGVDSWVDWVIIRKYTSTEPTYVIGAEQHQRRVPQIM